MKLSLNWLKDYIDFKSDTKTIVDRLTFLGFEIEKVEKIENLFENVVVGKVVSKTKHPEADKLSICIVDVGQDENLQIVCGAPNIDKDQTVPVALVGAVLGEIKIKKSKLRGVESCGMICAEDELGLSDNHDGIMILDDKYTAGTPLNDLFGYEDTVLEVDLTPNRPDMLGYFGFAREFRIFDTAKEFKKPEVKIFSNGDKTENYLKLSVLDPKACPRYTARFVKNVTVKESPDWLKEKLTAVGLRPINNIVDITNYVMMETGHPLHAFDYSEIKGSEIIVKKGFEGDKFVTLDDATHTLNNDTLMICDKERPLAMAGVMGGLNSGVNDNTKNVVLEVAFFNLVDIRHATRDYNISTDSARRFERGVDPNDALYVIDRAASLIEEIAGGEVAEKALDFYPEAIINKTIELRISRCNKVLGFKIPKIDVITYLKQIEFSVKEIDDDKLSVTVPTFRPDVENEIDLIEEVVRVHGYEKIPESSTTTFDLSVKFNKRDLLIDSLRKDMLNLGLNEICSRTMQDVKFNKIFNENMVILEHPLNDEMNSMRTSVISSLMLCASRNIRHRIDSVAIFESGRIFRRNEGSILEHDSIAFLLAGKKSVKSWNQEEVEFDFYDVKGYFEALADLRGIRDFRYEPCSDACYFDKNMTLNVYSSDRLIARFGRISKKVYQVFDIDKDVFVCELFIDEMERCEEKLTFSLKPVSKYPKVIKDLSILMDESMTCETVISSINKYGGYNLKKVEVIDFYQGNQIESGKKSYSFRLEFQSENSTLNDKDIEKLFNKVINGVKHNLKVEIR
ncbi:MAG: phenylalanine--tRNA ligase subunit beta [Candidatus Delongbacteria bacterium]|nr:phenylalanine--tRNA ligase subunit beta [Candidatus Delongbacteria bacterium]